LELPQTIEEVNRVAVFYKIDISKCTIHLRMDEALLDIERGYTGGSFEDNEIDIYPLAFINEETLARTLFHEIYHQEQYAKHGYDNVIKNHIKYERLTREAEYNWWNNKEWENERMG
jgi:hypothetical protein